jgi:hypothetical protein
MPLLFCNNLFGPLLLSEGKLAVNRQISNLFTCDCTLATNTTLKPEFHDYLLGRFW